ncbi:uncharacterized protein [Cherax quadricarinatus]
MAASSAAATGVSGKDVDSVTEHSQTRYTFPCWKSMDNFLSEEVQITGRNDDMIPRDDLLSMYKEYCQTKCVKSGLAKDFWRYLDTRGIHVNIIKHKAGHHIIAFVGLLSAHPYRDRPKCTHTSSNDSYPSTSSSNSFIEFLGEEVIITRIHTDLVIYWNLFRRYENFCSERKVTPASNYVVRRLLTILGVKTTYRAEKNDRQRRTHMYSGLQLVKEDLTAAASSCLQKSFSSSCVQENMASKSTSVEIITADVVAANTQTKDTLLDQQVIDHFLVKRVQITGKSDNIITREDLFSSYEKHCQIYRVKPSRKRDFYRYLDTRGIHTNIMKNKAGHHVIGFAGLLWTHPRRDCPSRISISSNTSEYHPLATSARASFIQFFGEELKITNLTSDLVKCEDLFSNYEKFCCEKNRIKADNGFAGKILASLGVKSVRKGGTNGQGQNCMYSGLQWVRKELTAANSSCLEKSLNSSCPLENLASKNTSVRCYKADAVIDNIITNDTVPSQKSMDDYLSARMQITGRSDDIVPREDVLLDYKKYCKTNRVKSGFVRDFCHYLDTIGIDVNIGKTQEGCYIIAFVGLLWAQPPLDCPSPCNSSSVSHNRLLSIKIARDSFVEFLGKEVKITKVSTDLVNRKDLFRNYEKFCEKNKVSAKKVLRGRILSMLGVKCITRRGGINGQGQEYIYSGLQWVKKNFNSANSSQYSFNSSCPQENSAPINTSMEFIKDDAVIENKLNDYPLLCNKSINDFLSTRVQITGRSDDVIPRKDLFSSYKRYCRISRIKAHPARYFWHYLNERGIPVNLTKNQVGHHTITYSGLLWVQSSCDCPSLTCNSSSTYNDNHRSISNARDYLSFVDFLGEEMKITRLPSDAVESEDLFRNYEKFCRERNKVPTKKIFIGHILDSLGVKATTRTVHVYSGLKKSSISSCLPKIMTSENTFMQFYMERLIITGIETDLVVLQELMTKYEQFCHDRQVNPLTAHSVGRIIRRLGVKKAVRLNNKTKRRRHAYKGLAWIKNDANPDYDLLTHCRNGPKKATLADKKKQELAEEHGTSPVKLREDGLEDFLSVWTTADAAEFLNCVNLSLSSYPFSAQVSKEL